MTDDDAPRAEQLQTYLEVVRQETRFEITWLHDRVNTLLGAEAFLTIAYTASMSSDGAWAAVVAPVLAALGLLLAVLARPGVASTVRLVMAWTEQAAELAAQRPGVAAPPPHQGRDPRSHQGRHQDQWRSMLFFRAVPGTFAVVWAVLLAVALVLHP